MNKHVRDSWELSERALELSGTVLFLYAVGTAMHRECRTQHGFYGVIFLSLSVFHLLVKAVSCVMRRCDLSFGTSELSGTWKSI